jgi:hypothetical protein
MKQIITKLLLLSLLSIIATTNVFAQFSVKTGYSFNYTNPKTFNSILQAFNTNSQSTAPYDDLHVMHGLHIGTRYDLPFVALEVGWINRFKNLSTNLNDNLGNLIEQKLFYRTNSISATLENNYGTFAYGGSINYNLYSVKRKNGDVGSRAKILTANNWSGQLYLSINTSRSHQIRLSIRPFVEIPLSNIPLQEFDQNLNDAGSSEMKNEDALIFGLKILFING